MPKSYAEASCNNRNVMGKNISFCIFPNRVKKKARWGEWVHAKIMVQAMRLVNADGSSPKGTYAYICSEPIITG